MGWVLKHVVDQENENTYMYIDVLIKKDKLLNYAMTH